MYLSVFGFHPMARMLQVTRTKNNFTFLLNYNGTFAGNYPTKKEVQACKRLE